MNKKTKNRKMTNRLILVAALILLVIGLYGIIPPLFGYIQGDSTYQNLTQFTQVQESVPAKVEQSKSNSKNEEPSQEQTPVTEEKEAKIPFPAVDFSSLEKINQEVNGWIVIDDTKVNYPTVKGKDNTYYLNHMFDRKRNAAGSIFMDYENSGDFSDFHNIIYGHHMKNGAMFAEIEKYQSQDFYNKHPEGKLITPDKNYRIHFISGYVANVAENAWKLEFKDNEQKKRWIEESLSKSDFKSNYTPKEGDIFLTLSTCSYVFNDARYVLLGVLEESK